MDTNAQHLIEEIARGNQQCFNQLFVMFKNRVYNTALSYLQQAADAEEITQDVFIEVYQSAAQFEGKSSVSTWIYRITINKCLDKLRYARRKKRFAFVVSIFKTDSGEVRYDKPTFEHPGVKLENKEDAKLLFAAIDKLPESQRTAFILSQVEDVSQKEIAAIMGLSVKAVESLIQRAKGNLRKELTEFYLQGRR